MKEFNKEISKDGVKSSPFSGLRGGMIVVFSLAFLYLLFAGRKGTDGNVSDNRMADKEIVVPYTPNGLDSQRMEVVSRSNRESEISQETIENKPILFDSTSMEDISISGEKIYMRNTVSSLNRKSPVNCILYCPVSDNRLTNKKAISLHSISSSNVLNMWMYSQYNIIPLRCEPEGALLLDDGCRPLTNGLTIMKY